MTSSLHAVATTNHLTRRVTALDSEPVLSSVRAELPTLLEHHFVVGHLIAIGAVTLFNRTAIAQTLQRDGVALTDNCADGEILLHLYARYGARGFALADGMFVLAILDRDEMVLARDHAGTRALFYTWIDNRWLASRSLRALRRQRDRNARLDLNAMRAFLTFAYLPGDETLIEGVYKVLPGRCLRLRNDGSCQEEIFWEPREEQWDEYTPAETYAQRLRHLLEEAVRVRLPADQDVGVFLSGGIDSSLVTALATRLHHRTVRTYSINFGHHLPNELAYSGLVATHCRTEHTILTFDGQQIADHLAETVALLDCPVGDPLTTPNLLLSRAAARDGLTVILNGEGGDPVFGGPKNLPMIVFELHRDDPTPAARARAYLLSYRKCYDQLERLLSADVYDALRAAPSLERHVQPYLEAPQMSSFLNRLLYTNIRTKGAHHILPKVERLTTACGLEGRSPLFAPSLIDAAFAIPPRLKLRGLDEKWILKQAVRDLLPIPILTRPKSGMMVPVQHWLQGPLRDLANDLLFGPRARARGLFREATARSWIQGQGMVWRRHGQSIWLLITLELWLRAYDL
ncbi:asparagine synthetase B family protein [Chloroflexus sp.]|uniref:asparagine synthetase B family protein n=1 Tax=Chloroflexus sp. TaxID=1904827 RepID=UPI002627C4F0|nr:asparagine synthase-related protein [uncultured Chloroflexus sp.]